MHSIQLTRQAMKWTEPDGQSVVCWFHFGWAADEKAGLFNRQGQTIVMPVGSGNLVTGWCSLDVKAKGMYWAVCLVH